MTKEEFDQIILNEAETFARDIVIDAEEHDDAVDAIMSDFIEGAETAWKLLTTKE